MRKTIDLTTHENEYNRLKSNPSSLYLRIRKDIAQAINKQHQETGITCESLAAVFTTHFLLGSLSLLDLFNLEFLIGYEDHQYYADFYKRAVSSLKNILKLNDKNSNSDSSFEPYAHRPAQSTYLGDSFRDSHNVKPKVWRRPMKRCKIG